jgi:hypothetical protein
VEEALKKTLKEALKKVKRWRNLRNSMSLIALFESLFQSLNASISYPRPFLSLQSDLEVVAVL